MSILSAAASAFSGRYWVLLIARAVPAAVLALVITFSQDHSVSLGSLGLGLFAIVTGVIVAVGSARSVSGAPRRPFLVQGAVLVVGGVVALFASDLAVLLFTTSAVFAVTGVIELVTGIRCRSTSASTSISTVARDWIFIGGLSLAFALAILLIPVDYSQAISVPDAEVPNLTASVILVGAIGAYAAIAAVYLVIGGLSLKWAQHPVTTNPAPPDAASAGKA